jgi:hypothetical protein
MCFGFDAGHVFWRGRAAGIGEQGLYLLLGILLLNILIYF